MKNSYTDALRQHRLGNLDEAERLYNLCLEEDPQNSDLLHLLSILLAQKNDFLNARTFAERALAISAKSPTLHNSMGNIMHNLGDHDEAVVHYKTSLSLHPDNASAHNNLGNVYYHQGKFDEAKDHYCKATTQRPDYVDAHYNLGLVLIKKDQKQEAKGHLEKVINLHPDHGHAHGNLGYLFQSEGDFDLAERHYQKSLETVKDSLLSHHNLGVILTNKGKLDEAVSYFKKALELHPEHEEALNNLGSVFLLQKKTEEALPYFLRLSKLVDDFDVYYNLGAVYLELNLLDDAITNFKKALDILPDDFALNANLGTVYLRLRDFAMAEKYYIKASSLHPDNEEVKHILLAIQKKNASSSPTTYVKNLFDQYSSSFEQHAEILGYRAPDVLFDVVHPEIEDNDNSLVVLDLGCGTGLSGTRFKPFARQLIGIDISEKMLDLAAKKNIYTDLRVGSIEDNLTKFSDVDLVIAADSLVYFGDLSDLFTKCYSILKEGGIFAFTVEITGDYPYLLQRSVRFAHSERYIREVALNNHFAILRSDKVVLRKQGQGEITGSVFVFEK